jgi:alkylation response protein AidB-like acyl-CoA dehydrogenase
VNIDQKNLLPGATSYKAGVETTLKYSRIIIIWNTVGAAIGVFEQTLKIAKNRK